jgi:hypothetical protein
MASLYEQLRRQSSQVTGGLVRMRQATFEDGAVAGKYKVLASLAIVVVGCGHVWASCGPVYSDSTELREGVSNCRQWVILIVIEHEFLNVAMTEGAVPESSGC